MNAYFLNFKDFTKNEVEAVGFYVAAHVDVSSECSYVGHRLRSSIFTPAYLQTLDSTRMIPADMLPEVIDRVYRKLHVYMKTSIEDLSDQVGAIPKFYKDFGVMAFMYAVQVTCNGIRRALRLGSTAMVPSTSGDVVGQVLHSHLETLCKDRFPDVLPLIVDWLVAMATPAPRETLKNAFGSCIAIVLRPDFPERAKVFFRPPPCAKKRSIVASQHITPEKQRHGSVVLGVNFNSPPASVLQKRVVIHGRILDASGKERNVSVCAHVPKNTACGALLDYIKLKHADVRSFVETYGHSSLVVVRSTGSLDPLESCIDVRHLRYESSAFIRNLTLPCTRTALWIEAKPLSLRSTVGFTSFGTKHNVLWLTKPTTASYRGAEVTMSFISGGHKVVKRVMCPEEGPIFPTRSLAFRVSEHAVTFYQSVVRGQPWPRSGRIVRVYGYGRSAFFLWRAKPGAIAHFMSRDIEWTFMQGIRACLTRCESFRTNMQPKSAAHRGADPRRVNARKALDVNFSMLSGQMTPCKWQAFSRDHGGHISIVIE